MPNIAEVFALAVQYHQAGDFLRAEALYRDVLGADARNTEALTNLGMILARQNRLDEAGRHYQQALEINPCVKETHFNFANLLRRQDRTDAAIVHYRHALSLDPDYLKAHNNLGIALMDQRRLDEAGTSLRQALRLDPHHAEAHNNLGTVLGLQDRWDVAADCYQSALRCRPDYADAFANLGNIRIQQGRFDEAAAMYERALRLDPRHVEAQFNRAMLWLRLGQWAEGWREYEWRWRTSAFPKLTFGQPRWDGLPSSLFGRTILVAAEQGLGDTFQFVRYARWLKQHGARVIVQCHPVLIHVLQGMPDIDQRVAEDAPLPAFDIYAPLLSLGATFATDSRVVASAVPYLHAEPALIEYWRRELEPLADFKIGIAWQGNPDYGHDRQRSIPLARFLRLARLPGVQLISLQKGPGTDQLRGLAGQKGVIDLAGRLDEAAGPFMDTAAVIKNVDLVICSDTVVAHLAGALGAAVWVALAYVPDWRWQVDCEDCPWYPAMRLFRQTRPGDWDDVFGRMAKELQTRPVRGTE